MGCGGSKLDSTQDDIPVRLKPILQRRLEEIRAKRYIKNSNNGLSKKELLGEEHRRHDDVTVPSENHSFSFTQDCPSTLQKISENASLRISQEVVEDSNVDDDDDEDDYERGVLGNGSPSFKVYCTKIIDEDELEEYIKVEDEVSDRRNNISQESSRSNEVSLKQIPTKKDKRRWMKFKIIIPRGGKLYKNMQLFSNFPCSSQTNSHLRKSSSLL